MTHWGRLEGLLDFLSWIFPAVQLNLGPRKARRVNLQVTVPQTDTGGLVENTKANG